MTSSQANLLASLPEQDRTAVLADLTDEQVQELLWDWRFWARPEQIAPDGEWSTWVALAGRGFGKTEAGAQWVRERVDNGARSIALVAETQKDLEEVMVARLVKIAPPGQEPTVRYKPVRVSWPSGAVAYGYVGTEPNQLRGPEFDTAWCFVAGTLVETPSGQVPIECIKSGDLVATRDGFMPVQATSSRLADVGEVSFGKGTKLVGTPDHPVYTANGWTRLDQLIAEDEICVSNAWSGVASLGTCTADTTSGQLSRAAGAGQSFFIGKYTVRRTVEYLKIMMSTTLTETLRTIAQKIFWPSLDLSTSSSMQTKRLLPVNGQGKLSAPALLNRNASIAGIQLNESAGRQIRFAKNAPQEGQSSAERSQSFAPVAAHSFRAVQATFVRSGASTFRHLGEQEVFCLNVAGKPEYFANGVLVHNCDELAKYRYAREAWDMLQFTMRSGDNPRVFVTTTPRPIPVLREILADPTTVVTKGSTFDNAGNLAPTFLSKIRARYEGTRLGRQELDAEILTDLPGALWTRDILDRHRVKEAPQMRRIVVAVDPSGTAGEDDDGDSVGIVVAGKGIDGRGYVLADRTCKEGPAGWARAAVDAYHEFQADRIVAETNFGGAMVESTVRTVDPTVSYRAVKASRGKIVRAEPIAALYEQGRVSHIGAMAELEDQMCDFGPEGYIGDGSPDRADALVWAMTELEWGGGRVYDMQFEQISVDPFPIPEHWARAYAISVRGNKTVALWGAIDPTNDTAVIYSEHNMGEDRALAHAAAIKTRGDWLRGVVDPDIDGNQQSGKALLGAYKAQGLQLSMADGSLEAGVTQTYEALLTGKLRVFSTLTGFANEFRTYARDDADNIIRENDRLMNCLRCWFVSGRKVARTRPVSQAPSSTYQPADRLAGY